MPKIQVSSTQAAKDLEILIKEKSTIKQKDGKFWSQKAFLGSVETELLPYVKILEDYFESHCIIKD